MNMLPEFMRKERKEPIAPPAPRIRNEEMRQYAMDFMNGHDRLLEEAAWLRSEVENLRVDLKAEREKTRLLETELNFVRDQHDRVTTHDKLMLGGLGAIKAVIVNLELRARAEAYAPPASGPTPEQQAQLTDGIATALEEGKADA